MEFKPQMQYLKCSNIQLLKESSSLKSLRLEKSTSTISIGPSVKSKPILRYEIENDQMILNKDIMNIQDQTFEQCLQESQN